MPCVRKLPEDGSTLGPWVSVTFEGSGSEITVSNESSPATTPKHVACIKSFEFGYSDGLSLRCVIHDEQGGSFVKFMENVLKHYVCLKNGSPAAVRLKTKFGWCKSGCAGPLPDSTSRTYFCIADSVETNFTNGKFMFEITGKDLCHRMFEGGTEEIFGGDGDKAIPITDAITEFLTKSKTPPNVGKVRFCKMEGGACKPLEFEKDGAKGPKGKWVANGQDKLTVVRRWLDPYRTKDKKGFVLSYNSEEQNGELIVWEDRKPFCNPQNDWEGTCIGEYVVNGGKESPVIEFNPKIRWDFARLVTTGGNMAGEQAKPFPGEGAKAPGFKECQKLDRDANKGAGHNIQVPDDENLKAAENKKAKEEKEKGIVANTKAAKILHDNIEADLTIVGDPTILPPSEAMWAKNVKIVVINPYFLSGGGCGDWLAQPVFNEVLTNDAWICKSVSHRIEAGNYTTTIGVYLAAPGIDIPPDAPLGGSGKGWKPLPQC